MHSNERGGAGFSLGLAVLLAGSSAQAWGPHSEITQAALDALGTNEPLVAVLGPQAQRLTNYCWLPDYFGVIMEEPEVVFYADDYLLFGEAGRYFDHIGPEIRHAFRPFWRRALQALRTENNANAARWVGALVHFFQDAGCPPHAAGLRGDVHSKMENWVETNLIQIRGYEPSALGSTDEAALQGLLQRIEELMPQAQDRGRRLRVPVEIGNRSAVRQPMLESALECARLTADLLHTLGPLVQGRDRNSARLRGTISSQSPTGLERFPARVVLQGTPYATLADLGGRYEFHGLPAGNYTVLAFRAGNGTASAAVQLSPGQTNRCDLALPKGATNLVLNGDWKQRLARPNAPDYWYQTRTGWEGEPIPLKIGQRYRLAARFKQGSRGVVLVRWTRAYEHAVPRFKIEPRFESRTLTPAEPQMVFTASQSMGLIHLTVRGKGLPAALCEQISLTAE